MNYLGQIVSAAGYRLDHSNVEAVWTLKDSKPSTVGEVRKLLGFLGITAGISKTLLGLPTHSSSYYRQLLKMWPNQNTRASNVPIMVQYHPLDQWCGRNCIRKLLRHSWTTSYLLQFLAILISISPLYYSLMHHERD